MSTSNTRRRLLAAIAASGLYTLGGIGRASAQEFTPCVVVFTGATLQAPGANYRVTAARAEFVFMVEMRSLVDTIVLVSAEQGGELREGVAAIKAVLVREGKGPLTVESMQLHWPITALKYEGQLYNIIQVAHDQNVPIGIMLSSGSESLGEIVFEKGSFSPDQPFLAFSKELGTLVHETMLRKEGFSISLISGGEPLSSVNPDTSAYSRLILDTLIPAMDEAARKDAEEPCTELTSEEMDAYLEGCFLTTACCSVIGLTDDCWELATLRKFRDGYMSSSAAGLGDIRRYYAEAPAIARSLGSAPAGRKRLLSLYWTSIVPAALLARLGLNRAAYGLYRRMMLRLLPT